MIGTSCHMIGTSCHMIGTSCHTIGTSCHTIGTSCQTIGTSCHTIGTPCHMIGTPCHRIGTPCHTIGTSIHIIGTAFHMIGTSCHTIGTSIHIIGTAFHMIGTSCLPHTTPSPDQLFYDFCKGDKRRAFRVKGDANEVQTKHKTKSETLAEHFTLDLRVCLPFSVSHDRMLWSRCHYFSIIMTDWLRAWTQTQTIIRPQNPVGITTRMSQI